MNVEGKFSQRYHFLTDKFNIFSITIKVHYESKIKNT